MSASQSSSTNDSSQTSSPEISPTKRRKHYHSWVWEYFNLDNDNETARCKFSDCRRIIKSEGTSGMKKHLENFHNQAIKDTRNNSLSLVKLMVKTNSSFTIVDNEDFRYLAGLNINRRQIPDLFYNYRKRVEEELSVLMQQIDYCSLMVDEWTSDNFYSFIGIVVVYIYHGILQHKLLHIESIQDHNFENIEAIISNCLNEWNIREKVISVTSDHGSALLKSIRELNFTHLWCMNHILNLCLKDLIQSNQKIKKLFQKMKNIGNHFYISSKSRSILQKTEFIRMV